LERGWRLEMLPPAALGRAAINGQDQFITRLGPDRPAGIEIRQGQVNLDADSRVEGAVSDIPAVGWDHDFTEVSAELNLPPAWRLFHARGVDDVSATWISTWSLLDLFLVLIGALSIAKLRDWRWGAVALLTLGLSWTEPEAPQWSWLAVLLLEALTRALPPGKFLNLMKVARGLALVVLVMVAVPFMVRQVRAAIYPALEQPHAYVQETAGSGGIGGPADRLEVMPAAPVPSRSRADLKDQAMIGEEKSKRIAGGIVSGFVGNKVEAEGAVSLRSLGYLYAPDPKAVVQTGPGLPDWRWRSVDLRWRGPVKSTQRLRLFLVPPLANRAAGFVRVGLIAILVMGLYGVGAITWPRTFLRRIGLGRAFAMGMVLVGLGAVAPRAARASEIPPQEMLDELRDRLLSPPECRPNCASSPRMALEATPGALLLRIEIDAAAGTAVPLPGGADQWLPERVILDGNAPAGLVRSPDGRLWLRLTQGNHQVMMEGPLPDRDAVQIPLPLKPHRVTARASGWRVEGLHEDGLAEDNLQLVQVRTRERAAGTTLEPGTLPPFVRVERNLMLGLKWEVETRVVRMTPPGAAIVLDVPLLAGESVTSADIRVKDGRVSVSLGPLMSQTVWSSTLEQRGTLNLKAPDAVPWVEIWRLQAGPVWHVEPMGIPVVHQPEQAEVRMREWRPWPGETVAVEVTRPQGLPGQTLTIDRSALSLSPGLRAADATLDLALRSSRGAQHVVTLPVAAELQSVSINGVVQPIRQEGRDVTLPVVPGAQQVSIVWRQNEGIGALFRAPDVRLNAPSVNLRAGVRMPMDRWILLVGGPRLGPAVLFWSLLAISLIASIALGRARLTPLRPHHWFLLSLGLTQAPMWIPLVIAAWLFALGWRKDRGSAVLTDSAFDACQILLALGGAVALSGLFWSIAQGLLGLPEMQIAGNGSTAYELNWFQDRSADALPRPWVLSVPLLVYRLAMLAWALWLAQALLRWLKWGWECFTAGGAWRPLRKKRASPPPLATQGGAPS
ncbi:MAG TPA: hypothetical protein VKF61_03200, partial [Candidatus Polarisedimenticolia bacterium]|nr:hypothetical protein [Candidatus Polarisedimenticolia bacterium]